MPDFAGLWAFTRFLRDSRPKSFQDPDTVVARVTKSRAIALFRKYMIGKRRSHEEADGFAGRNVAEFLDLLGVKERLHAESVALLSHVEMGVVRDRDVREQKRRRIE